MTNPRPTAAIGAALVIAALLLGVGCAGYASYPALNDDTALNDPNSAPMTELMVEALKWTISRRPVEGPYAINLPEGMSLKRIDSVFARLGDPNARPLTAETSSLPTYHIARIAARISNAEVDVVRPVLNVKGPQNSAVYQMITVYIKGGLHPWRAQSERAYMIGVAQPPPVHFIPESDSRPFGPSPSGPETPAWKTRPEAPR